MYQNCAKKAEESATNSQAEQYSSLSSLSTFSPPLGSPYPPQSSFGFGQVPIKSDIPYFEQQPYIDEQLCVMPAMQNYSSQPSNVPNNNSQVLHQIPKNVSVSDEVSSPGGMGIAPVPLAAPPVSPGVCMICQDRATGKHYGANSCDGCKGFFRRTVRKNQAYTCRYDKNCVIDKDKRNSCRYCRFRKCQMAGMKRDAVQNERDRINPKRPTASRIRSVRDSQLSQLRGSSHEDEGEISSSRATSASPSSPSMGGFVASHREYIVTLLRAEEAYSKMRSSVIKRTAEVDSENPMLACTGIAEFQGESNPKVATMSDVSYSMGKQLLLMVEWAKMLSPFFEVDLEDQIALLKGYAAQHLLICVAYRSRHLTDNLLLTNDTALPREPSSEIPDVNHVTVKVLDELVAPMRDFNIDETEFVCLRAIIFFNPNILSNPVSFNKVNNFRQSIILALQEYCTDKRPDQRARFANLLLLLPPLQVMAQNLIEDLQLASLFGMAEIDSLLNELLLNGSQSAVQSGLLSCKCGTINEFSYNSSCPHNAKFPILKNSLLKMFHSRKGGVSTYGPFPERNQTQNQNHNNNCSSSDGVDNTKTTTTKEEYSANGGGAPNGGGATGSNFRNRDL